MSGAILFVNIWKTRHNRERHWPSKLLNLAWWKPHRKILTPLASAKLAPNADDPMSLSTGWVCANSASRAYDIPRRRENNWPKREGVKCPTEAPHFHPRSGDWHLSSWPRELLKSFAQATTDAVRQQASVLASGPSIGLCGETFMGLENRMTSRGNPNWGKPYIPVPSLLTEFEQQAEKLGLRPGEYQASSQL